VLHFWAKKRTKNLMSPRTKQNYCTQNLPTKANPDCQRISSTFQEDLSSLLVGEFHLLPTGFCPELFHSLMAQHQNPYQPKMNSEWKHAKFMQHVFGCTTPNNIRSHCLPATTVAKTSTFGPILNVM
jgi:hypothetical protein